MTADATGNQAKLRRYSAGKSLDAPARTLFGQRFAQDMGQVRVHVGAPAARLAQAAGAKAYAAGNDIVKVTSWGVTYEGVNIDKEDWQAGRSESDVETGVKGALGSNTDSILLHSRVKATAEATPAILAEIQSKKLTFDPTAQGAMGSKLPLNGFAGLTVISDPPTSAEIAQARVFLQSGIPSLGGYLAGSVAIGILQMAQKSGKAEVDAFIKEIHDTTVDTPDGKIPMANWMNANPEWSQFAGFFENWATNQPFPRIKGVTI